MQNLLLLDAAANSLVPLKKKLETEVLGLTFENALCGLYETPYVGNYKYSLEEARILQERLIPLKTSFPYSLKHIAKNGNKYDFGDVEKNIYLSAKTTKKDGKVCPQVIGQSSKKKFCEYFHLDPTEYKDLEQIKHYIVSNVSTTLMDNYFQNTFDCPVVYYNKYKNKLLLITRREPPILWTKYNITFSHLVKNKPWNESTTVLIIPDTGENPISIGEFQIHNHRDCIKFRWSFEKFLDLFREHFDILSL